MKVREKYFLKFTVVVIFLILITSVAFGENFSKFKLILGDSGTLYFLEIGWFKNETYPIRLLYRQWHWKNSEGNWQEIATPYEYSTKSSNGTDWVLVLERNGEIYMRKKDRSVKYRLKVIGGKWCRYDMGEWYEIPGPYD